MLDSDKCCGNCSWWNETITNEAEQWGFCKRKSPLSGMMENIWPKTRIDEVCGDFELGKKEKDKALKKKQADDYLVEKIGVFIAQNTVKNSVFNGLCNSLTTSFGDITNRIAAIQRKIENIREQLVKKRTSVVRKLTPKKIIKKKEKIKNYVRKRPKT